MVRSSSGALDSAFADAFQRIENLERAVGHLNEIIADASVLLRDMNGGTLPAGWGKHKAAGRGFGRSHPSRRQSAEDRL